MSNYDLLDQPSILQFAFFPRPGLSPCPSQAFDLKIEAGDRVSLHCRFYVGGSDYPTILYFHGNGEIVSDHDGLAPLYHDLAGANLAEAEFRGYGAAGGRPAFKDIVTDAHRYVGAIQEELKRRHYFPGIFVMGRSMGSVAALELAAADPEKKDGIAGLIIESGFTCATFIARRFGVTNLSREFTLLEEACRQKARGISLPSLVIHGEMDDLVPLAEAETLYGLLGSADKQLVVIPGADHNNILFAGKTTYFSAIRNFINR